MMGWVKDLVATRLLPPILGFIKEQAEFLRAAIVEEFREMVEKYAPLFVEVIVRAIAEASIKLGEQGVDKITDMIPGDLDDQIIDPIARTITQRLGDLFGSLRP